MEYKMISPQDEQDVKQLWHYCFEKNYDPFFKWYFAHYYQVQNTLGCYADGQLAACLQLIPYQLFLRGKETSVSYIVGVSTYPQARGTGAVKGLLKAGLAEMKRRGQYVSILMPSKAEFYYPHQWELCYHQYKYFVPMPKLAPLSAKWGEFSPYQGYEDITKLAAVYKRFVADKHAYVLRSEVDWKHLLDSFATEEGYVYLLMHNNQAAGYIFYTMNERKLLVREMAYVSHTAQQALFRFMYNHRSQADEVEWLAPCDDMSYLRLPDPKREVTLYPFMSGRVVDVKKALESLCLPPLLSCRFFLAVQDPLADWNNQCFDITIAQGRVAVKLAEIGACEVSLDIGAFSQMYFGRVDATELFYMGRLQGENVAVALLSQLFPKCHNYINEYF